MPQLGFGRLRPTSRISQCCLRVRRNTLRLLTTLANWTRAWMLHAPTDTVPNTTSGSIARAEWCTALRIKLHGGDGDRRNLSASVKFTDRIQEIAVKFSHKKYSAVKFPHKKYRAVEFSCKAM
ncbi:hypothetical protein C8R45DRAFT_1077355 [Mycena sanguinolenta]|nr:hypothetical protein C8R45DRAFT_1077355 [Mycena sanguinolenta]